MTEFMKFRKLLMTIIALFLLLILIFQVDYSNLSFANNKTTYISIISAILLILALYFSNRIEMKKN